jgi:hypothetical protein
MTWAETRQDGPMDKIRLPEIGGWGTTRDDAAWLREAQVGRAWPDQERLAPVVTVCRAGYGVP